MRRKARKGGGRQLDLRVERMGARGDGIGQYDGRPLFLEGALPGEFIRAQISGERGGGLKGRILELIEESAERVAPPCQHFGPCGGCSLQHWDAGAYRKWKAGLLTAALSRQGLESDKVAALREVPPGRRRRADLSFIRLAGRTLLGFHERETHKIVDLERCLLLTPALSALIAPLRQLIGECFAVGDKGEVVLLESESGPDLLIRTAKEPGLSERQLIAQKAEELDLARVSWGEREDSIEVVVERRAPKVLLSGIAVTPPPGAFLQPSAEGEAILVEEVLRMLPEGAGTIADLYCGLGTFTFALAARGLRVHGVEGVASALAALWTAARRSEEAGRVTVEERDLARQPILPEELEGGDAVVFDPPRAGAREQAEALAASGLPTIIAVSCNPSTFARDARILVDGGYRLDEVVPVDQFPWSGHLELVARFSKT